MGEWERCLPNLHPQSPSLSGGRLIHAAALKHNTLSHWASLTVETCSNSVALSSNLQETSRQTARWERKWAIIMTPTQDVIVFFWIRWIHLSLEHPLHSSQGRGHSFYKKKIISNNFKMRTWLYTICDVTQSCFLLQCIVSGGKTTLLKLALKWTWMPSEFLSSVPTGV